MKKMLNWIHLSDIHHNYNNYDTIKMRDRLIRYIKDDLAKNTSFDFLAITGDISFKGADYIKETYTFIKDIVDSMGITLAKVYIVPGNHDLKRSSLRTVLINSVINNASSVKTSNDIDKEIFQNLLNGQDMFFSFYKNLLSKDFPRDELHFVTKEDMYNIIHINTCWLAGADKEEGKLVICQEKLYKTIKSLENEKSINIALGHHSIDCLNLNEQEKFMNNLDSCGIDIYLCGHTHKPGYHFAADGLRTIPMIVCGSNIVTDYANSCFVTGKIDFDTCAASIVYHSWDNSGELWYPDNAIGRKLKNGELSLTLERLKKEVTSEETAADIHTEPDQNYNTSRYIPKPKSIFTGRAVELSDFKKSLNKSSILFLEGLGGIGKTDFALKFIAEYLPLDKVIWFECLPDTKLDSLIEKSGFPDIIKGENKTETEKHSAYSYLIEKHELIIFVDNFQDINDNSFIDFLKYSERRLNKSKLILITRIRNTPSAFPTSRLDGLKDDSPEYARNLIKTYYPELMTTDIDIIKVCDKLKGHPLAIELAIQLLRYGETPDNIIERIVQSTDHSEELSRRLLDEIFNHPQSSEQEKNLLFSFSVFRSKVTKRAMENVLGADNLSLVLPGLINKLMINVLNGFYETHPLIREFCYHRLENKEQLHKKAAEYFKSEREDRVDPFLEETIFYHLASSNQHQKMASLISEKGEDLIMLGYGNSLKDMIDKTENIGISLPEFYLCKGEIARIKGKWDNAMNHFEEAFSFHGVDERISAEAYIKYGEMMFRTGEIKNSLDYFEDALKTCRKINYKKGEAHCLNYLGRIYDNFGLLREAESKYNEAFQVFKNIPDKKGQSTILNNIGTLLEYKGDFNGALQKYNESLNINRKLRNKEAIAISFNNIGILHDTTGNYEKTLEKLSNSLIIHEEIGNKEGIANVLNDIANFYLTQNNLNEAKKRFTEALRISKEIGYKIGIATSYNTIGRYYRYCKKGDFDKALKFHKRSLDIYIEIGDKKLISYSVNCMGLALLKKGKLAEALKKFDQSMSINIEIGDIVGLATSHYYIGSLYKTSNNYPNSLSHLFTSIAMKNEMGLKTTDSMDQVHAIKKVLEQKQFQQLVQDTFNNLPDNLKQYINIDEILMDEVLIDKTISNELKNIGRNDPCPCGSGKKYKKCCG